MSEPSAKPRAPEGKPRAATESRAAHPTRREIVDSLVEALAGILEHGSPDVPDWVAQELTFGQMRLLFLLAKH